ncbi:MAG TPA: SurA N-terminal domain-containing protein [Jiangellaceae bacterium]
MLLSRRVAAVASSAVLAVALAACDADQIGAAAVVGGERITVADLQEHTREVAEVGGAETTGDQAEIQRGLLNRMISFRLDDQIERDTGISISEAEIDEFIADQLIPQAPDGDLTPLLAQNWLTEETLRDAVRQVLTIQELGGGEAYAQAMAAAAEEVGVEVNPRYGAWDGTQVVQQSGSISVPVGGLVQ